MTVLKALGYTALLVLIWAIAQLLLLLPIKYIFLVEEPSAILAVIITIVTTVIAYLSVFFLFDVSKHIEKQLFTFKSFSYRTLLVLPLVAFSLYLCDRVFWDLFNGLLLDENSNKNVFNDASSIEIGFVLQLVSVLIISPIFEELFFRKFLFNQLLKKYSLNVSLVVSSFCFSIIHIETPHNLLATFFGGLVLATLFYKTKNILTAIITHSLFNSIVVFLGKDLALLYGSFNYNFWYWVSAILGLISIYLTFKFFLKNK